MRTKKTNLRCCLCDFPISRSESREVVINKDLSVTACKRCADVVKKYKSFDKMYDAPKTCADIRAQIEGLYYSDVDKQIHWEPFEDYDSDWVEEHIDNDVRYWCSFLGVEYI